MATYEEVLQDKTKYPDEQTLTMADGTTVTLGALRGGYMRQQDYTRKTTEIAEARRRFEEERQTNEASIAQAREDLTKLAAQSTRRGEQDLTEDEQIERVLHQDPAARRLLDKIEKANARAEALEKAWVERQNREALAQKQQLERYHESVIAQLQQKDPALDRDALVRYAIDNGIARLDVAYRDMNRDKLLADHEKTVRAEEQKKAEEAITRVKASQPILPTRRALTPASLQDKDAPKTFEEAAAAAEDDPEIQSIMFGQTSG